MRWRRRRSRACLTSLTASRERRCFPIEEHAYPESDVPGEKAAPTQPMPTEPAPFARQRLTEDMLTTRTPAAHAWAVKTFATFAAMGSLFRWEWIGRRWFFRGFDGGAEWGGPAVDPATGVLYVNANEMAWTGGLTPDNPTASPGAKVYQSQCAICHGANRAGSPPTLSFAGECDATDDGRADR